jgi:hypothetical protein
MPLRKINQIRLTVWQVGGRAIRPLDERRTRLMTSVSDPNPFTPNCAKCHGLCCVALKFDWPHYRKPAGQPCRNLTRDFKCAIWNSLEAEGFTECRSHDCFGAGQHIAQAVESQTGKSWRDDLDVMRVEFSEYHKLYAELHERIAGRPAPTSSVPGSTGGKAPEPAK